MHKDFLSDLCAYCTEDIALPQEPKQHDIFFELEQEFSSHMGYDFVMQYQAAAGEIYAKEFDAAFLQGLRFAAQFILTALPPQSPSAP